MTLQEAKDEIAKKYGFTEWQYIDWYHLDFMYDVTEAPYMQETCTNEAAELYARSKWKQACEEQRKLCSDAYMAIDVYDHSNKFETIDREINAIKNAPKPEFKP